MKIEMKSWHTFGVRVYGWNEHILAGAPILLPLRKVLRCYISGMYTLGITKIIMTK